MLGTSIFSISLKMFSFSFRTRTLTLYHAIPTFNNPLERGLLKTLWEKKKMLIFSFSQNVFNLSVIKIIIFSNLEFVICKCFEFGPV